MGQKHKSNFFWFRFLLYCMYMYCLHSSRILKARSMRNHWEVHLFWHGLYFYIPATIKYIHSSSCKHTYPSCPCNILRLQGMRLTALLPIGQHQFSFNGLPFTSTAMYIFSYRYNVPESDFKKYIYMTFSDRSFIVCHMYTNQKTYICK